MIQRVTTGYYGLQGLKRVSGKDKALHRVTKSSRGYKGLHRLQGITKASRVTKSFKGLQTVTNGYKGRVTRGNKELQGVTGGYKGLQGVHAFTGGYKW